MAAGNVLAAGYINHDADYAKTKSPKSTQQTPDSRQAQHKVALSYAAIYYYGFADKTELDAQLDAMGLSITERFNPYPMVVSKPRRRDAWRRSGFLLPIHRPTPA